MAKTNSTAAEVAATISDADIDAEALRKAALEIYLDLVKGEMRGRDTKLVAQAAYARARDFVLVSQAIAGGAAIPVAVLPQNRPPLFCKVTLWDLTLGEFGGPMKDTNGQPIEEVQPVDRDAFAPNLPKDHPINQRYFPNALASGKLCDAAGSKLPEHALN